MRNIYGDGHAAEAIVRVLTVTPLEGLLHKRAQPISPAAASGQPGGELAVTSLEP